MGFADFVKFRTEDYKLMQNNYPDSSAFKKLVYCWKKYRYQKRYNFAHMEFFTFHLGEKKKNEVANFFPRKLQADLYLKVNDKSAYPITKDKYASYWRLKEFYKRTVCAYNPSPNLFVKEAYESYSWQKDILDFLGNHMHYIIKPLAEACGRGVKIINREASDNPEILLNQYMTDYPQGFVLEELIQQHDFLAKFHPSSVNTIRLNVFNSTSYGGVIDLEFPCFRIGRKGAVVDNAGNGGIMVAIDVKTGEMISAADEDGRFYQEHPDTHVAFVGIIPFWKELLSIATQVALAMPELRIAGLDFALDKEKGWMLVEINCDPHMLYEIATQKGIREYMENFAHICGV